MGNIYIIKGSVRVLRYFSVFFLKTQKSFPNEPKYLILLKKVRVKKGKAHLYQLLQLFDIIKETGDILNFTPALPANSLIITTTFLSHKASLLSCIVRTLDSHLMYTVFRIPLNRPIMCELRPFRRVYRS